MRAAPVYAYSGLVSVGTGVRQTGAGSRKLQAPYSLYSDFYWYEIGDVICIGDARAQYYCFPQNCGDIVAKTRLATEELYKLTQRKAVM